MAGSLPDRAELLERLNEASGKGSVAATKLLLEELRRDAENAPAGSEFDALDNVTPITNTGGRIGTSGSRVG